MLNKLVICLLLVISTTQALIAPETVDSDKQQPCLKKILWYNDITLYIQRLYEMDCKNLTDAKLPSDAIEKNQSLFQEHITSIIKTYDLKTLDFDVDHDIPRTDKYNSCDDLIHSYKRNLVNLTTDAIRLKSIILDTAHYSKLSSNVRYELNKNTSELVNFLFIASLKNPDTSLSNLVNKCSQFMEYGVELENEWILKNNEVEVPDDPYVVKYDDDEKRIEMIEEKRSDREMDEFSKSFKDLDKLLPITKNNNDDDDDDEIGPFVIINKIATNHPGTAIAVSSVVILTGIIAGAVWIVYRARSGRYSTFT